MNNLSKALLGLAMGAAVLPAFADDSNPRPYYLDLDYSRVFADSDRQSEDGNGYNVGLGKQINKYWNLELDGFYNYMKQDDGGNRFHEYGGKVDGQFFYSRDRRFSPYVGIGVGGIQTSLNNTNKSFDPFVDAGVGAFSFFDVKGTSIGLRADLRYRRIINVQNLPDYKQFGEPVLRVGLVIPFGLPKHQPQVIQVSAPCCAAPPPAAVIVPPPAKVVEKPAPAAAPIRTYTNVFFDFNKSDITPRSAKVLDGVASEVNDLVKTNSDLRVTVGAHTDAKGTPEYNQKLSERRASAVKEYLVKKGVAASRITTGAFGEAHPEASNDTAAGRALNRHADVNVYVN